jgi:hypothetical protein
MFMSEFPLEALTPVRGALVISSDRNPSDRHPPEGCERTPARRLNELQSGIALNNASNMAIYQEFSTAVTFRS